jgi:hypothetical protein
MFSCRIFAQDINAIFNNKLTRDGDLSSHTKAIDSWLATYGELQTTIYRYNGSFEDAVSTMKAPDNADVSSVTDQPLGNNISLFIMMTDNLDPKPMGAAWYEEARAEASELADRTGKSLSITIGSDQMQNPDNIYVGAKIKVRLISLNNPYLDLDNLKVVEGTWVSEIIATTTITQEMLDSDSDEFENEWDEQEMDMDVDLPAGSQFVGFDDVADSEFLQGDVNYLVEMSTDQVINFFRNNKKRFINSFEQSESYSQDGAMITSFYLLKHQGDLKVGDDVVSMTIQPAPKGILSDALGRNQGTWTLISISRWTEEDY